MEFTLKYPKSYIFTYLLIGSLGIPYLVFHAYQDNKFTLTEKSFVFILVIGIFAMRGTFGKILFNIRVNDDGIIFKKRMIQWNKIENVTQNHLVGKQADKLELKIELFAEEKLKPIVLTDDIEGYNLLILKLKEKLAHRIPSLNVFGL